jgi:hypothetical protein
VLSTSSYKSLLSPTEKISAEQLETDRKILAFDRSVQHLNRRGFLGAMLGAAALATAGVRPMNAQTAVPIVDVLNFALNLEYLEANFYLYVSTGTGLSSSLNGNGAAVQGAPGKLALDANTLAVAQALAADEVEHIVDLRTAISSLGGSPVPQPVINLAANGAITTQAQFLAAARQFTALGGSAYIGGAQLLVSNPTVLTTASQILGAEGQHAGVIAYLCISQGVNSPAIDAQDIPPTTTNYITVDPVHALSPSRTPSQVLGVAYRASTAATTNPPVGVTVGGFFPNGFNGNVKST